MSTAIYTIDPKHVHRYTLDQTASTDSNVQQPTADEVRDFEGYQSKRVFFLKNFKLEVDTQSNTADTNALTQQIAAADAQSQYGIDLNEQTALRALEELSPRRAVSSDDRTLNALARSGKTFAAEVADVLLELECTRVVFAVDQEEEDELPNWDDASIADSSAPSSAPPQNEQKGVHHYEDEQYNYFDEQDDYYTSNTQLDHDWD